MTGEEMEKTVAFILDQQAQLTANVGKLAVSVDRLSAKVDRTADSVTALLAIAEIHEGEIGELRGAAKDTDERLNALIETVERYIAGRNGQS